MQLINHNKFLRVNHYHENHIIITIIIKVIIIDKNTEYASPDYPEVIALGFLEEVRLCCETVLVPFTRSTV